MENHTEIYWDKQIRDRNIEMEKEAGGDGVKTTQREDWRKIKGRVEKARKRYMNEGIEGGENNLERRLWQECARVNDRKSKK